MSTVARRNFLEDALAPLAFSPAPASTPDVADETLLRLVEDLPAHDHAEPEIVPEASPWTLKQKALRAAWMLVGKPVFRCTFHNWYGIRRGILRAFGAKVGKGVRVRPSANIEIPWNVELGDDAVVGDHAILYSLGKITIGARAIVSQYAHLCAGTHDIASRSFKLIREPVTIGAEAWIAAEAFVAPGVEVGPQSVLGCRSSAFKPMEAGVVYVGSPAKPIRRRVITRD